MLTPRSTLTRRIVAALDASPSKIPVLLGGCGAGRTSLLHLLRDRLGRTSAQYIDVERTATTPERFLRAIAATSPFPVSESAPAGARAAFEAALAFLQHARTPAGGSATFLLDEVLELRTFESFPGLRRVLHELVEGLSASGNRFVLTSRYTARALRALRDRSARFEIIHLPGLTVEDTLDMSDPARDGTARDAESQARTALALADGRPAYVRAILDELAAMQGGRSAGPSDPVGALAALLAPDGRLARHCGFSYELRLHRARGYGALKAILEILAEEEGLTLTEISLRLHRTPGSTKDYLSWLQDVDLVTSRQKRYSFTDPLLRVWVRLHCRASAPTEDEIAREVHRYALPRLPQQELAPPRPEPAYAMAALGSMGSTTGLIEID